MAKNRHKGNKHKGAKADPSAYFTEPYTRKQAVKQAKLVSRIAVAPERRQIKAEQRASHLQEKRVKGYFKDYIPTIDQAADQTQAAYDSAASQIGADSQATAAYAEQLRQRLQEEGAADAATRGVAYSPKADTTDAQAQLARMNSANVLQGVTHAQGASAAGMYASRKNTAHREKIEQLLREQARGRTYNEDLTALARQQRDLRSNQFNTIADAMRDYVLARQSAHLTKRGQTLDAKASAASRAESHRHNVASESISAQNASTSAKNAKTSAKNAATSRKSLKERRQQDRYERRHPNAGEEKTKAVDHADVERALVLLRTTKPGWFEGKSKQAVLDAVMSQDQTISRQEAARAYNKWVKRNLRAPGKAITGI